MRLYLSMLACTMFALAIPSKASAEATGQRQILQIGCHLNDDICYVTISGSAAGPSRCRSTSIRWNSQSSTNGKNLLSLLTAAYLAGKKVNFAVSDSACFSDQPTYPTFDYANVE
ncbi:hypothetical protein WMF38_01705 [Sorangium sp. So ce118]